MRARAVVVAPVVLGLAVAACARATGGDGGPVEGVPGSSAATPAFTGAPALDLPASAVTTVATGLRVPWGMAFLPDGTALITERGNKVPTGERGGGGVDSSGIARILSVTPAGEMREVQRLPEVDQRLGEGGLLGIAVSPSYATDGWVFVYYSAATDNRVARLKLGQPPEPILTGIPVSGGSDGRFHQGGRLAFGPDGLLYLSVGETYFNSEIAQDRNSLGGKILRMTLEGKPPPDNPFPNSLVWSYGHRNVQGLAWDPQGRMYASEFGSKTYDELNVIEPGRNYGWPKVEGFSTDAAHTNPIATWTPTAIASPSGIAVHGGYIYVGCLRGQGIYRLDLDGRNPRKLLTSYGRIRTVMVAPDGSLWASTSNRDQVGREDRLPQNPEGDRILRITP
jgi:glucose/arabinose dehydrogenase